MGSVRDVNEFFATGRVSQISELRETNAGVAVCDVFLANKTYYGGGQNSTTFIKCTFWGDQAENVQKVLDISDTVHIRGRLVSDNIVTQDGTTTRGRLKVDRSQFRIISKGRRSQENEGEETDVLEHPEDTWED